ncbi:MAG: hypothetical protein IPK16_01075 [Anaerolineales bacterium]|nr:hypothetical protein [Anaerolineales bacterium]
MVFGLVIKERVESILYNGVVCLGPEGDVVGDYRKVHLLGEERQVYRNGFRFANVDAEWGRFGMLIGADLAFPEAAQPDVGGCRARYVECKLGEAARGVVAGPPH